MSLNEHLIRMRFNDIRQSLERLERISALSQDTFLADQDTLDISCYRLLVAIEAALQICFHVSAQQLGQVPDEYAACFGALADAGVISRELCARLQRMARFRNMLVHVYWQVDYRQVYRILQEHLGDLRSFVHAIGQLL